MVKFRTFQTEYQRSPHIKTLICYVTGRRDNMLFRTYTKLKYIHIRMSGIEEECLNDFTWYLFPKDGPSRLISYEEERLSAILFHEEL